jgi:hypothetical protein
MASPAVINLSVEANGEGCYKPRIAGASIWPHHRACEDGGPPPPLEDCAPFNPNEAFPLLSKCGLARSARVPGRISRPVSHG